MRIGAPQHRDPGQSAAGDVADMDRFDLNGLGPALFAKLRSGEAVEIVVKVDGATLIVTSDRLAVGVDGALTFDVRIAGLRRLQFDIEPDPPATLSIVPESATKEPQILAVLPHAYDDVSRAITFVGHKMAVISRARSTRLAAAER
jgi:hypothetical protein